MRSELQASVILRLDSALATRVVLTETHKTLGADLQLSEWANCIVTAQLGLSRYKHRRQYSLRLGHLAQSAQTLRVPRQ